MLAEAGQSFDKLNNLFMTYYDRFLLILLDWITLIMTTRPILKHIVPSRHCAWVFFEVIDRESPTTGVWVLESNPGPQDWHPSTKLLS